MMKRTAAAVFLLFLPLCIFARGSGDSPGTGPAAVPDEPLPEQIDAYFFYEELCGSCRTDVDRFASILQENLPMAERDKYPNSFSSVNIVSTSGRTRYVQVTDDLGLDRSLIETPFMIIGGRVYQGYDSITANIREAYLTAVEDLFVYKRPYNPQTRKTGTELFADFPVSKDHATLVYFYRVTCNDCAQITPIIDALPAAVPVNGRETPLDIIRFNTRSGNNSERVMAFFEAWHVPDEDRMVPIVFFSDSYLAGVEAISEGLDYYLSRSPAAWKLLPERR